MQAKISHIENVVFSADMHGTRFNKPQLGRDIDVMNEANAKIDGADDYRRKLQRYPIVCYKTLIIPAICYSTSQPLRLGTLLTG